jgi:hypothetical protein
MVWYGPVIWSKQEQNEMVALSCGKWFELGLSVVGGEVVVGVGGRRGREEECLRSRQV